MPTTRMLPRTTPFILPDLSRVRVGQWRTGVTTSADNFRYRPEQQRLWPDLTDIIPRTYSILCEQGN